MSAVTDSEWPWLPATVAALEADRSFDGSSVRTVAVDLSDGTRLRLRVPDHFLAVGELPGVERELTPLAYPGEGVRRLGEVDRRIERPETWETQWSADLYGVVTDPATEAVHSDERVAVLDVGVGSVYVHGSVRRYLPDTETPLDRGAVLHVPASVVEVWELHP